jgi:hypothetical protein
MYLQKLQRFNRMRDTKTDWQMIYYANAVHGFTNPDMEMIIQRLPYNATARDVHSNI